MLIPLWGPDVRHFMIFGRLLCRLCTILGKVFLIQVAISWQYTNIDTALDCMLTSKLTSLRTRVTGETPHSPSQRLWKRRNRRNGAEQRTISKTSWCTVSRDRYLNNVSLKYVEFRLKSAFRQEAALLSHTFVFRNSFVERFITCTKRSICWSVFNHSQGVEKQKMLLTFHTNSVTLATGIWSSAWKTNIIWINLLDWFLQFFEFRSFDFQLAQF